jgi:hypothetical protein
VVVTALVALVGCGDDGPSKAQRRATVAARGARVMPFDLEATTHTFTDTENGGVQTVTADDPADVQQVTLVRDHLRREREKFARGDYEDPAAIHGHDMDGVAELAAGFREITVTYDDVAGGGRLTYRTDRDELIAAIHAWFARQVADHGAHAEAG